METIWQRRREEHMDTEELREIQKGGNQRENGGVAEGRRFEQTAEEVGGIRVDQNERRSRGRWQEASELEKQDVRLGDQK